MKRTPLKRGQPIKSSKRLVGKSIKISKVTLKSGRTLRIKGRINPVSNKQKKIKEQLSIIYEKRSKRSNVTCKGCNRELPVQNSHIIPRSRREDLIAVEENITDHCIECHLIWEYEPLEKKKKMHDYNENMEYIKSVDNQYYQLLIAKGE